MVSYRIIWQNCRITVVLLHQQQSRAFLAAGSAIALGRCGLVFQLEPEAGENQEFTQFVHQQSMFCYVGKMMI